jgi:thioredoxin 1
MASDLIINVTDADFKANVLDSDTPVLVDFWATWCAPCRALAPKVEAIASEYAGKLAVAKVDIDKNRKTAMNYNVRSIPTVLVFKGGEVVGQVVGNVDQDRLKALVTSAM